MLAIGLMSGTSLDGVDACLVEIKNKRSFKNVGFICYPYEQSFKDKLLKICNNNNVNIQTICSLNVELSLYYIKAIEKLLKETSVKESSIEFIAMHGQTVWHNPARRDGFESSTLQLGDASRIAQRFATTVVSNFRTMDMSAGGGGAPLVPFANYILYSSRSENIALQNIGGISNVTYLPKGKGVKDIIGFDTGPGNILIDQAMRILFNEEYDNHGRVAFSGKVCIEALDVLFKDPYLTKSLPKSTGREAYNDSFVNEVIKMVTELGGTKEDVITTLAAYTADTICDAYKRYLGRIDKVILSGGGAFNDYIVKRISQTLKCSVEIEKDFEALEALSFAVLGYYTIKKLPSNVPSVTGASHPVILGEVCYGTKK